MKAFAMVVLTVLPLVGCSQGPTQPTTSAAVVAPSSPVPRAEFTIWRAESTVVGVSATLPAGTSAIRFRYWTDAAVTRPGFAVDTIEECLGLLK